MKMKLMAILFGLALLVMPSVSSAHEYDRDDSDYPLRYVAYVMHPIGIAAEYLVLRPIHWLVSQPNADVIFGHEPRESESYDYFEWH